MDLEKPCFRSLETIQCTAPTSTMGVWLTTFLIAMFRSELHSLIYQGFSVLFLLDWENGIKE